MAASRMEYEVMKRSPALLQLSREHHTALVLAKRAQGMNPENTEAVLRFMAQTVETFTRELEPHFQNEETRLLPALERVGEVDLVKRTLTEHEELRRLVSQLRAADTASLSRFGATLEAHVRFEERELFEVAEAVLSPKDLEMNW